MPNNATAYPHAYESFKLGDGTNLILVQSSFFYLKNLTNPEKEQ